jgi:hypothetical protein
MSELEEIDVIIAPDGHFEVRVRGVKGKGCLDLTREMEALLGEEVLRRDLTDEYDEEQQQLEDWNKAWR